MTASLQGKAGGFLVEHSELVPYGPRTVDRFNGRMKLPAAIQGKMKG